MVLIATLKLSKAKDTRAQIDNSADFSESWQRIYTSSNQSLKNEKKSIRFETVKIESRKFSSNSVLKQISFDSYQLFKIFIFSKKRESKKYGSNSAWPLDSVCAIVMTLQRSSKNLRNFKNELKNWFEVVKKGNSRRFLTLKFFYSDCRVGQIRPLANFEQFWYSRTFKKIHPYRSKKLFSSIFNL